MPAATSDRFFDDLVRERTAVLVAKNDALCAAIEAIQLATIAGRVCDDVAWFDQITTLHDYCADVLDRARR